MKNFSDFLYGYRKRNFSFFDLRSRKFYNNNNYYKTGRHFFKWLLSHAGIYFADEAPRGFLLPVGKNSEHVRGEIHHNIEGRFSN